MGHILGSLNTFQEDKQSCLTIQPLRSLSRSPPYAVENVLELIKQRNLEGHALRIYVAGSPKLSISGMALEGNIREEDFKAEIDGSDSRSRSADSGIPGWRHG